MIYDCFLFNNELEVLDIRLHELEHVVDKFVLVESTVTHSGKPKELLFNKNKRLFAKFKHKIIHIIIDDTPDVTLPWIINDYQFSQIVRGLKNCKSTDTIIFGDVDEVPSAKSIKAGRSKKGKLKVFSQSLRCYFLNCAEYSTGPWYGSRMMDYRQFVSFGTPWIAKFSKPDVIIPDGGWHFSYMGGTKRIADKISSMTHQEFNLDKFNTPEKISRAILSKKDLFELGWKFKIANMTDLPQYVQENPTRFKLLLATDITLIKGFSKLSILLLELKHQLKVKLIRNMRRRLTTEALKNE